MSMFLRTYLLEVIIVKGNGLITDARSGKIAIAQTPAARPTRASPRRIVPRPGFGWSSLLRELDRSCGAPLGRGIPVSGREGDSDDGDSVGPVEVGVAE